MSAITAKIKYPKVIPSHMKKDKGKEFNTMMISKLQTIQQQEDLMIPNDNLL